MKNFEINLLRAVVLTCVTFLLSSFCTQNYIGRTSEKDAQFLVHATEINFEEIKLGQLAQSKSMMEDVKELGKMVEEVHSKSQKELTALARKKDVTIPLMSTYGAKESYRNLESRSGTNFDKAYCKMMVDGHKEAIELFEKAAKESDDKDIKKWAEDTLPTLRKHLSSSVTCQEKCEKAME